MTATDNAQSRFIQVDGVILRMDFLRSPASEPRSVVLLLIVANKGVTRILLYRWNSWQPLSKVEVLRCSGQPLQDKDSFPHLLIPSCRSSSFAIVTGHEVVFYDDLSSKRLKRSQVAIPADAAQKSDKLWVQWAKPIRHETHKKSKEDIILVREDGLLKTIVVSHKMDARNSITFEPGHLQINVDTAVCTLSAPPSMGGDILIACGDTTQGGVYHLAARASPRLLQTIPNWCPINDVVSIEPTHKSGVSRSGPHVVAATGLYGRASLTELRYGLEGQIEVTIQHSEGSTIDQIWALTRSVEGKVLMLASYHEHTTCFEYVAETDKVEIVNSSIYPGLCFSETTRAASGTPEDGIVQITTKDIRATGRNPSLYNVATPFEQGIVCADVHWSGIFAVAGKQQEQTQLLSGEVVTESGNAPIIATHSQGLTINYVPVCLALSEIAGRGLCVAGSQSGCLYVYSIEHSGSCIERASVSLKNLLSEVEDANISSISVLALPYARQGLLLCGLKTGQLICLGLSVTSKHEEEFVSTRLLRVVTLGSTAVTTTVESNTLAEYEKSAFVTCENASMRLLLHRNEQGLDFQIDSLILTDKSSPSYDSPPVTAVDRVGRISTEQPFDPSGLLLCAAGDELLLVSLGPVAMLPRPIRPMHASKHIAFPSSLKRCVASHQGKLLGADARDGLQLDRPSLQLYDIGAPMDKASSAAKSSFYFGEKGEKVKALLEWKPSNDDVHYEFIVVGSDVGKDGRVVCLTAKKMLSAKTGITPKLISKYPGENVTAICAFGSSSLVIGAGRKLYLVHLNVAAKAFINAASFELPSRATEIRQKGNVVYVATSLHSFMLIRIEDDKFKLIGSDSYAGKARNILPHDVNSTLINLVSDSGSRLLNFGDRPTKAVEPTFEATVPQAIDRLLMIKHSRVSDERTRFLGTTIDGTVYLFTTLNGLEMKLLDFLEGLTEPRRTRAQRDASVLGHAIARQYRDKLESANVATPSLRPSHARGDVLRAMLEPGPYNIQRLLQKQVKVEDGLKLEDELDVLKEIATPVIGESSDIVQSVLLWLRRILNVPSL